MSEATVTHLHDDQGRDPRIEAALDDLGIPWTFDPALPLDQINVTASLANQARVGEPLDDETVDRYAVAMADGAVFPAVIARRTSPRAKLVLLGGNHRRAAAEQAGRAAHAAYIVECSDEAATICGYRDNLTHGKPTTAAERALQAVHLVNTGWTQGAAAKALGLAQPQVSNALGAANGALRARELGVAQYDALVQGSKIRLASITNDAVFVAAVRCAAATNMPTGAVNDFVKKLNGAKSEKAALELVDVTLDERMQSTAGGRTKPKDTEFKRAGRTLFTLCDLSPAQVAASAPSPTARKAMLSEIADATAHLAKLTSALKR